MTVLICKQVIFYSPGDEQAFFQRLSSIKCIRSYETRGDELRLHVSHVTTNGLWELMSLFYRYNIDMKQLRQFVSKQNQQHFRGKDAWWYARMFE